ncbi:hypothetical protein QQZ08_005384 [Neonectria magnoliae]|uniref:UvrD-like helicase C-terminal domain-containing protein n=1 Tax=Neonectria magnoliae TaxID=2732573 RepID=A0ABR1I4J5_9HYPO
MIAQSLLTWRFVTRPRPHSLKLLSQVSRLPSSFRFFTQTQELLRRRKGKPSFTPSPEQLKVVKLCLVQNVVVSARPGSGKTATAEAIVAAYPDKRVAVLTYSKALQRETERRLRDYLNCKVLTFHGMAGSLFGVLAHEDAILWQQRKEVHRRNELPVWDYPPFDIVVLDEFQDCTKLLFWLTNCFLLANKRKAGGQSARLVVLGDERQSIYRYRGADHRYLTLAPELLGPVSPYPFAKVPLDQSFRLSKETVRFINNVFLGGEPYITSSKSGPKPIVMRCYPHASYALAKELSTLIKDHGAKNTAILAPTIRTKVLLQEVINILCKKYRVPVAVPIDDEAPLDDRVVAGKLCVSTIHKFKGSERDLIILFGMDSSYFTYFGRDLPDDSCPNEVFVALTRAAKQLVVIHNETKKLMPFVSVEALYETADVVNMTHKQGKIPPPDAPGRPLKLGMALSSSSGVRDMTRHVQDEFLGELIQSYLHVRELSPKKDCIAIENVVLSDPKMGFYESVSDINGLVVVAAFEYDVAGTLHILGSELSVIDETPPVCPKQRIAWLCRKACEYQARSSGYLPRVVQMENHKFNWIEPEALARARGRLQEELGDLAGNLKFEVEGEEEFSVDDQKTRLRGRADIMAVSSASDCTDGKGAEAIWEVKFVSELSNEHIIQACTYAYLLTPQSEEVPRIILYNVRDGEKKQITPRGGREGLRGMIEIILRRKYTTVGEMTHGELIEMCAKTRREVSNLDGSEEETER